jgi:hypothetical protein
MFKLNDLEIVISLNFYYHKVIDALDFECSRNIDSWRSGFASSFYPSMQTPKIRLDEFPQDLFE